MTRNIMDGPRWQGLDTTKMLAKEFYGRALADLADEDPRIVALTADLEKTVGLNFFHERHPDKYYNFGIAEQNMMGSAAGMAQMGLVPFVSTMAIFAVGRACEQVRTDICYQNLPVKIVSTHAGVAFGLAGTTHHCTEDLAIVRSFANMTLIVPADGIETVKAIQAAIDIEGPVYLRIGRAYEPPCYEDANFTFIPGKANMVRDGSDLTIICCGMTVLQSLKAANELAGEGISCRVLNMHTIKPLDEQSVLMALADTGRILTVEEHNVIGGLGEAVASVIASSGRICLFRKKGINDVFSIIGLPDDLYAHYGLNAAGIAATVREILK